MPSHTETQSRVETILRTHPEITALAQQHVADAEQAVRLNFQVALLRAEFENLHKRNQPSAGLDSQFDLENPLTLTFVRDLSQFGEEHAKARQEKEELEKRISETERSRVNFFTRAERAWIRVREMVEAVVVAQTVEEDKENKPAM